MMKELNRGLEEIWIYTYLPCIGLAVTNNCILNLIDPHVVAGL